MLRAGTSLQPHQQCWRVLGVEILTSLRLRHPFPIIHPDTRAGGLTGVLTGIPCSLRTLSLLFFFFFFS